MSLLHQFALLLTIVVGISSNTGHHKILCALPLGSSQKDIERFSLARKHYKRIFNGTVDWALFHYQDIDVWKSQPWYEESNIVLSIDEIEFAYHYFYKYLTPSFIKNLNEYDWIWLLVSDCDYEVFDAKVFVDFLELWSPGIAQPANTGFTTWPHTRQHSPSHARMTNLVEIGPLLSIRVDLWESLRSLMDRSFNTGWGIDNIMCTYIAKFHGYTLDPFNRTDISAMPRAWVVLSEHDYFERKSSSVRAPHRICPEPGNFKPACLIVDASPLKHLDFHEGKKAGIYTIMHAYKEVDWYRDTYTEYFVNVGEEISYCTSSVTKHFQ